MDGDTATAAFFGGLALAGVAFVLFQAWLLMLCARVFADAGLSFGRAVLAVVVAGAASAALSCAGQGVILARGAAVGPEDLFALGAAGWLVWALVLAAVANLDMRGLLLTSLGLAGVNAVLAWAIEAAWYVGA